MYTAIDPDTKLIPDDALFGRHSTNLAAVFLPALAEKHDLSDTIFLVNQFGYRTGLARLGLNGRVGRQGRRVPKELSGGQRQRVGIARALAVDPPILLMDEPFGSVDARTKASLHRELLDIWAKTEKTICFVTHDIEEAVYLSDRIVVFSTAPGTVLDIIPVQLSRPRDRTGDAFTEIKANVLSYFEDENA